MLEVIQQISQNVQDIEQISLHRGNFPPCSTFIFSKDQPSFTIIANYKTPICSPNPFKTLPRKQENTPEDKNPRSGSYFFLHYTTP